MLPDYLVTSEGIVEKNSGNVIDDISIHFLGLSTRACNAICRWGMMHGKMADNTIMLSTLLTLSEEDIIGMPNAAKKTWDEICAVVREYLSSGGSASKSVTTEPETGAILSGWVYSGGNLVHIQTGKEVRDAPILALNLNTRARNGLEKLKITRLSNFVSVSYEELLGIRYLGVGTVSEIGRKLNQYLANHMQDGANISEAAQRKGKPAAQEPRLDIPAISVPVLAEDYAVVDGQIIRRGDFVRISDATIEILRLSIRGNNCLRHCNITKVSQLIGMPLSDFRSIRGLGAAKANEIIEKLELYLEGQTMQYVPPCDQDILGQ